MLYWLWEWQEVWGPFRVFQYISVRAFAAAATAFVLSLIIGPPLIRYLVRLKVGQHVRDDEILAMQRKKAGTPTMGGVLIVGTVVLSCLLWARPGNLFVLITLVGLIWNGAIGFVDDYLKLVKKNAAGLKGRYKLVAQTVGVMLIFGLMHLEPSTTEGLRKLYVPFLKNPVIHDLTMIGAFLFLLLVIVGASNAVNLTDGMDGLAIGCCNAVSVSYLAMTYVAGHAIFAEYLNVPFIPGSGELAVFFASLLGAGLGFLWFNCHPARVFMGDTGSLALGGAIGTAAALVKQELVLVIVGGVFVMEALSVVIQVAWFKRTGRRVFRCAPIHHHFEVKAKEAAAREGRDIEVVETMITIRFWILSIVFAIIGIATLKIR